MENLKKYKDDLDQLIDTGDHLLSAIKYECFKERTTRAVKRQYGKEAGDFLDSLPVFSEGHQAWYSEATRLILQLLPNRLNDFCGFYETPKGRKNVNYESYRISDYVLKLSVIQGEEKVVGPNAAIPRFRQQLAIVKAVKKRFESSLFDIRQLVQADLFDSELEAAKALVKNGFLRSGGALAGVVMEKHLAQVCENHGVKLRKKNPTIGDYNDALKTSAVIDTPVWRSNQLLGDIRNRCDHHRDAEPTREQVTDLVDGVAKLTKTVF